MYRPIFVSTWCGPDTAGGAEHYCGRLAQELRRAGYPVEIWTTTARGYTFPWFEPYYPEGLQEWDGVPIRHFPLQRHQEVSFFRERPELLADMPSFPEGEMAHLVEMPQSDALYRAIEQAQDAVFFFFIYSHNLSFWGGQIAPERTVLFPTLHDEPYAYHNASAYLVRRVHRLLCLSEPERQLALALYLIDRERTALVGGGVDVPAPGDAWRFERRLQSHEPFLFYLGRRDQAKRVPELVRFFCQYVQARRRKGLRLLLAGPGEVDIPPALAEQVIDLGYVSEQDKQDAYAAAAVFCLPSQLESYSLVLMEAWLQGTPVLVNAAGQVAVHHCQKSHGGLYYRDYAEFEACLDYLLQRPALRRRLGAAGRDYVLQEHTWPATLERVLQALEGAGRPLARIPPAEGVDQAIDRSPDPAQT
ncbi:MAG: glycosyltransferase family 4 protein [Chloroflexia bacterium]|nr:glycosyltransferase family 4 protein [Chloroflexia bacterium]